MADPPALLCWEFADATDIATGAVKSIAGVQREKSRPAVRKLHGGVPDEVTWIVTRSTAVRPTCPYNLRGELIWRSEHGDKIRLRDRRRGFDRLRRKQLGRGGVSKGFQAHSEYWL